MQDVVPLSIYRRTTSCIVYLYKIKTWHFSPFFGATVYNLQLTFGFPKDRTLLVTRLRRVSSAFRYSPSTSFIVALCRVIWIFRSPSSFSSSAASRRRVVCFLLSFILLSLFFCWTASSILVDLAHWTAVVPCLDWASFIVSQLFLWNITWRPKSSMSRQPKTKTGRNPIGNPCWAGGWKTTCMIDERICFHLPLTNIKPWDFSENPICPRFIWKGN